ncbi:hypothetical protein GA0115254_114434 [Streptomyces sp. Ncost-T10-10d]|nr:hypothetical protein GA0115254_114434 [Streptomyces sp. Ncost-T10-10d]
MALMRSVGLEPLEPYPGATPPWRCRHVPCGREVKPRYSYIKRGGGPCRWCAPNAPVDPDQAAALMRSAGLEPLELYPGTDMPWRCRCTTCGTIGTPTHGSVKGGQGGCGPCGRKNAGQGISRAWSRRRELPRTDGDRAAIEAKDFDLEPLESYPGPSGLWHCRHLPCGRDVEIRLSNLRRGLRACPYCPPSLGGRRRWPADEAEALMRAADLEPLEPYAGRRDKAWRCRCNGCGRETSPSLGGILAGQGGCRHCADVRAAAGRKTDPDIAVAAMRAAGLEPLEPYATSVTAWRCRCVTCGNEVSPTLMKIRAGGGCKFCATHGIDLAGPSKVYVITHQEWKAVKIGIGACTGYTSRLIQHERQGWQLHQARDYTTGAAAYDVEQAVLGRLHQAGLIPFLTSDIMPNGWTETCSAARITAAEVWAMVDEETRNAEKPYPPRTGGRPRAAVLIDAEAAAAEMRAVGYEPLVPYPGRTNATWPSRCMTCGHEGRPTFSAVRNAGQRCRVCRAKETQAKRAATNAPKAQETMRAAGLQPLEPYPGSQTPWRCRCTTCGLETSPTYSNVNSGSKGCRFCALNSATDERASAEVRAAGFEPLEPYPGRTTDRWRCRCSCGNEVMTRLSSVRSGTTGCKKCPRSGGRTDPATAAAEARAAGFEPLEPYPGKTTDRWRCRCRCSTAITLTLTSLRGGRTACGTCSRGATR